MLPSLLSHILYSGCERPKSWVLSRWSCQAQWHGLDGPIGLQPIRAVLGMEVSISASAHNIGSVRLLILKVELTTRHVNLKIERCKAEVILYHLFIVKYVLNS